ncbi:PREDICTED: serine/threonine-protein phosphatase 6 regulatory subunit 1 isoform X2 [Dipodomys ordii]|uniref:Serine/threonine-protein phosphatase 6 regulatory subunit 1 isoform X1 n=2 Tax=Dipodomys ordii TaxID=10020 RepID=A0A1S3GMD2_DIPOR|nr:PREDICTED: serine/threonine-protein phosphatase 6 regulatory subunit 1 isoform X1 [Dipodomys ordii]XP_012890033.1 PREDICTED: serine/threonine-protein phosphatase 6 regulatory subunit 1 isoform X2 [Dipodomys ordii]
MWIVVLQGAMFWKFDLHTSSHLDTLLEREDLSLPELLDEEDVLQECKVVNRKLLDFLLQPPHLQAMVAWVTQEPPISGEERLRYKYPSVACDILTSDVPQINDALGADESLLNRLYGFLQSGGSLNPLLASFFSKVMGVLINRKTDQLVSFLRKKDDFVDLLLRHIGTSAIMDLLLRLLTCVERPQLRQDVLNWLNEEKIVQRLIEQIHPSKDDNQHSNASQSLCDITRLSREQMIQGQDSPEPDQLLATLEKQETIEQLLSNMFEGEQSPSVIVSGIQVLLTLLEPRRPRSESMTMNNFFSSVDGQLELLAQGALDSATFSPGVLNALRPRLGCFHQLLLEPPKLEPLQMTWGSLAPPLGNTRLHVVKLLASALSANDAALTQELLVLDVPNTLLDLFFHYVFNNFLHAQVEVCVSAMLSSGPHPDSSSDTSVPNPVVKHLLQHCCLVERILTSWEENDGVQSGGGPRKGYMGHLTRVANALVQNMEQGPNAEQLGQLLKELPDEQQERWEMFVSGPLAETNKRNTVDLVNTNHLHSSSDDEDDRLKEFNFPEEAVLQQAFMDFQMQRMTSAFIDHFGFNDEEFGEQEESVNAPFDKTANITFSLNADDENPNANLLEICYKDRIQQFDDDEEEEEGQGLVESDGEYGAWQSGQPSRASRAGQPPGVRSGGSTDSEEDEEDEEDEDEEGDRRGACVGAGPPFCSSPGSQPLSPNWRATFDTVPVDTLTGPQVSREEELHAGPPAPMVSLSMSLAQNATISPVQDALELRSQDASTASAPQEAAEALEVVEAPAPDLGTLCGMCSSPSSLDSAARDPSTSVPASRAQQHPRSRDGGKNPETLSFPESQSARAHEPPPVPNGSALGGPGSPDSQ